MNKQELEAENKRLKELIQQSIKIYFMELDPSRFNSSNYVAGKGVIFYGTVDKDGNQICFGEMTQENTTDIVAKLNWKELP